MKTITIIILTIFLALHMQSNHKQQEKIQELKVKNEYLLGQNYYYKRLVITDE